jgi:hypothetical protein
MVEGTRGRWRATRGFVVLELADGELTLRLLRLPGAPKPMRLRAGDGGEVFPARTFGARLVGVREASGRRGYFATRKDIDPILSELAAAGFDVDLRERKVRQI